MCKQVYLSRGGGTGGGAVNSIEITCPDKTPKVVGTDPRS